MTKFKWWWSWNSDKFEVYLEEMATKGYVLKTTGFSMMLLTFEQSEAQNIRYCVDYNSHYSEEYELLLQDDGWVCKGNSSGWRIWAKAFKDQRPELFSDINSIIERNQRLLKFLFLILMTQIPIAIVNYNSIIRNGHGLFSPFGIIVGGLYTFLLTLLIYSAIKISGHNKRLRK